MTLKMEQEIDISGLWRGIVRRAPWILGTTFLLTAGTYLWSNSRPQVYSANASLISSNSGGQAADSVLGGAIVKAPPLPEGAIPEAPPNTESAA